MARSFHRRRSLGPPALLVAVLCVAGGCTSRTVYVGGPIVTVDAEDRVVEALGIEGDRIAAVGSEEEVRRWAGDRAHVVDLEGRAIIPGFVDAHGHFPGEGVWGSVVDLNSPPIGDLRDLEELVERLRAKAAETPKGEWVTGMGYDDTLLPERRHPTRADLDRVSTEHPIGIMHISGHLAALNSLGLASQGWTRDTPDMAGGVLQRDAAGELTGVVEENAVEPLQAHIHSPSGLRAGLEIVRRAAERAASEGVTTAQSGYTPTALMRLFPWLSRFGLVPIRLMLWPAMEAIDEVEAGASPFTTYDPEWVRVGAVKLVADGSIQGYTGYLREPYHVPPEGAPADTRGYPRIARDELFERVQRYHDAGHQLAIHGNGDASIDDILDALEAAFAASPRADARPVIIHAQMTRDDQLDRMKTLGVVPSFFSLHTYYWGDRHRDLFLGPERAARISPAASAIARDVTFTMHCDAPVVPMTPLKLVWTAVNRRTSSGHELGPAQRISPERALRAVTYDAAWQGFEEDLKGSLEVGKLADFVVLSRSPLEGDPATIDAIRVDETFVGGTRVFRREP